MYQVVENLNNIINEIPKSVKLIAVSKTKPVETIMHIYNSGYKIFGESKVQELIRKHEEMPKDIEWHLIGHLQSNKVKYIVPFVSLIHSVDSFKLLKTINKEALKIDRKIQCLLQMHIAEEETKYGFLFDEIEKIIQSDDFKALKNVVICGLMGMATFTDDEEQVKKEFTYLRKCFEMLKSKYFTQNYEFKEISMGMSGDYRLAIDAGSTMIRVGSNIFGIR